MPGGEKRQQVVDELLLRHRLAALGMPRREQARQQIVAGSLIFEAAGDEASHRRALLARGRGSMRRFPGCQTHSGMPSVA